MKNQTMQICDVIVTLSRPTSTRNETIRFNVTPAEVVILMQAKGPTAVSFNGNLRRIRRTSPVEATRLIRAHGDIFKQVYPGNFPILPSEFSDIEFDVSEVKHTDAFVPAPDDEPELEEHIVDESEAAEEEAATAPVEPAPKARGNRKGKIDLT